jgi:hypothetical protein
MIAKGNWKGQYKYDDRTHQQLKKVDATNFEIDIIAIDGDHFTGIVQDDIVTGGTEGIGEINGKVIGNHVEFVKQMPVMTFIDTEGVRKILNKKQRKIYYSGTISGDQNTMTGQWRFKFGLVWVGIIPVLAKATHGTWTMTHSN